MGSNQSDIEEPNDEKQEEPIEFDETIPDRLWEEILRNA